MIEFLFKAFLMFIAGNWALAFIVFCFVPPMWGVAAGCLVGAAGSVALACWIHSVDWGASR